MRPCSVYHDCTAQTPLVRLRFAEPNCNRFFCTLIVCNVQTPISAIHIMRLACRVAVNVIVQHFNGARGEPHILRYFYKIHNKLPAQYINDIILKKEYISYNIMAVSFVFIVGKSEIIKSNYWCQRLALFQILSHI